MEWRKIYKSISTNWKFARLPEFSQLLFLLIIIHADDYGRLSGVIPELRMLLLPMNPKSDEEWEKAVLKIAEMDLIWWDYEVIQVQNWDKYQSIGHRRKASKFREVKENSAVDSRNRGFLNLYSGKGDNTYKEDKKANKGSQSGLKRYLKNDIENKGENENQEKRSEKVGKGSERSEKVLKGQKRFEKVEKGLESKEKVFLSSLILSYIFNLSFFDNNSFNSKYINKYIGQWAKKIIKKWFNRISGKESEVVKSNLEFIEARLREGYSLRMILITIKWFIWQVKIEEIPRKYLRIKTLFRRSNMIDYWEKAKEWHYNKVKARARQIKILGIYKGGIYE